MQLQSLSRRDPQRRVADLVTQVEFRQELVTREPATGDRRADHEVVKLCLRGAADTCFRPGFGAPLAVVLLIGAVVLQELRASLRHVVGRVGQVLRNLPQQIVALRLELLERAQLPFDCYLDNVLHVSHVSLPNH